MCIIFLSKKYITWLKLLSYISPLFEGESMVSNLNKWWTIQLWNCNFLNLHGTSAYFVCLGQYHES